MPVRHQDAHWRIPPTRHVFGSQSGGQHTDGLGCGGGTSNAQFWPDELLQRYGSRTNVPTGAIGKLDGPHQDLHFRVCRNRLAQFWKCLTKA